MAAGKVCTGFSLPYVALYSASGNTVSYTSAQKLARGVNVDISPDNSDDNNFYADKPLYSTPCVMVKKVPMLYHITLETPKGDKKEGQK